MLPHPSAREIARQIAERRVTAREVCDAALTRIDALDPQYHAFIEIAREHARERATEIDALIAAGRNPGPLAGVPIAVKDNLCTHFGRTTCGSRYLADYRSAYDATAVERIEQAGGIIVGKTNLDEFAMGSSTETSAFGLTRNPLDDAHVAGGSSGGSAVAVATGMAPLALGSDTGGSIRQPAAFCGVFGVKPTYGRVSRYGLVAFASSLDQVGVFANDLSDAALLLQVIAGPDSRDATCVARECDDYADALQGAELEGVAGRLRIGVPRELLVDGLDPAIRAALEEAVEHCRRMGFGVVDVALPHAHYAVAAYYLIATAECSSNLSRFDGVHYGNRVQPTDDLLDLYCASRSAGFGDEVKRRIMLGTFALSAGYYDQYYQQASRVRRLIQQDFEHAFQRVDLLLGPTTPTTAFKLGEKLDDPLQMYLADVCTIPASLAGLPAMSIPAGRDAAGLPIGLQLIGPAFAERRVLQGAALLDARHARETPAGE